jgi:hypothetical protein
VAAVQFVSSSEFPELGNFSQNNVKGKKGKAVPLHAMEALGGEEV